MVKGHSMPSERASGKVAITTVTYFRSDSEVDRVRSDLALLSVEEARGLGYAVFIADGGSYDGFSRECESRGANIEVLSGASFAERTRHGIKRGYAAGAEVLMRLEIEKTPLISQIAKMIAPIYDGDADFVVPHRGDLKSYPPGQRHAERFGDIWFKDLTGLDVELDMWGGTRVWGRELTQYFLDESIDQEYPGVEGKPNNWACYFVPVLRIINDGLKVESVPIEFTYSQKQAALEAGDFAFTDKRILQLKYITDALRAEWSKLHPELSEKSDVTYQSGQSERKA